MEIRFPFNWNRLNRACRWLNQALVKSLPLPLKVMSKKTNFIDNFDREESSTCIVLPPETAALIVAARFVACTITIF